MKWDMVGHEPLIGLFRVAESGEPINWGFSGYAFPGSVFSPPFGLCVASWKLGNHGSGKVWKWVFRLVSVVWKWLSRIKSGSFSGLESESFLFAGFLLFGVIGLIRIPPRKVSRQWFPLTAHK